MKRTHAIETWQAASEGAKHTRNPLFCLSIPPSPCYILSFSLHLLRWRTSSTSLQCRNLIHTHAHMAMWTTHTLYLYLYHSHRHNMDTFLLPSVHSCRLHL